MQHVENDMDDLFQRAAQNYPLQNGKGDWESIAKRINPSQADPKSVLPLQKKSNKKLIACLLLFAAFLTRDLLLQKATTKLSYRTALSDLMKEKENIILNDLGKEKIVSVAEQKKITGNYSRILIPYSGNNFINESSKFKQVHFYHKENFIKSNKNNQNNYLVTEETNDSNILTTPAYKIRERSHNLLMDNLEKEVEKVLIAAKTENITLENSLAKNNKNVNYKKATTTAVLSQKKIFYIGLEGGPDFSKVRSASFNNPGFDAGLLAGMSINNKLSFETGIIWNKKNYRSEGTQFSMDKVKSTMPAGMIINNLESESSLIEIPLTIQYNFIHKKNSGLFISTGISVYIMTKEKNMYNVTMNGTAEKTTGMYEKNNYGLPAVASISAGYVHKVSKYLELRIAPFLKIPLQGMGVGSLPITSTGLHAGIIHRFK